MAWEPTGGREADLTEYDRWNEALAERYFIPEAEGRAAYLAVDDDEIAAVAASLGSDARQGSACFAAAVCAELRARGSPFWPLAKRARVWRREGADGIPPYLGLLGFFVLAGSRMAADERTGLVAHAYYPRLNQLLGRSPGAGMPEGFDRLWWLWEDLNAWLEVDREGRLGRATSRTHPHLVHIGWPLSQCVLRAADRRRLPDFFRSVGLEPGADIGHAQLWALLRNWAQAGGGLSERGRSMIDGAPEQVAEQIAAIVARELETWDGELRDSEGRRRAEIALLAQKRAGDRYLGVRLIPRRPEGFPEGAWSRRDGRQVQLVAAGPGWFRPLDIDIGPRHLSDGLALEHGNMALALEPSPVVPLRASLEPVAGWVSTRQAQAVEEHIVLAHASVGAELRAFLGRHAEEGWRQARPDGNLPAGWTAYFGVRITSAIASAPPAFARLAPRLNTATHIEGGLEIAPRQYLMGGEPDLWITVGEGEECEVDIDGAVERLRAGVVPIRLSALGLQPGAHQVRAGGMARNFTSFQGFATTAPAGTGALGHRLERHGTYRPSAPAATELPAGAVPRGHIYVSGARPRARAEDLPAPARELILLRTGFSYTLLGSEPGQVQHVLPPPMPGWLHRIGLGNQVQFFDHPSPFAVEWAVRRGGLSARLIAVAEPPRAAGAPGERSALSAEWAAAVLRASADAGAPEGHETVWWEYEEAARLMLDGADGPG